MIARVDVEAHEAEPSARALRLMRSAVVVAVFRRDNKQRVGLADRLRLGNHLRDLLRRDAVIDFAGLVDESA